MKTENQKRTGAELLTKAYNVFKEKETVKAGLLSRIPVKDEFIGKYEAGHIFMVERAKAKEINDYKRVALLDEIWHELPDNTTKPKKAIFVIESATVILNVNN